MAGLPATGLGLIGELVEKTDEDGKASPVLVIEEEGDDFIANAKKDKRVGTMLRKAWDGATIGHKTRNDNIQVRKPHLGVVVHCQPKNWAAISGSRDATGGTFNRFLPLAVEQSKTLPVFSLNDPADEIQEQAKRLRRLAAFAREVDVVTVPQKAAQRFEKVHRPAIEALVDGNDELGQMTERALAYVIRLAALYALADGRAAIKVKDFDVRWRS